MKKTIVLNLSSVERKRLKKIIELESDKDIKSHYNKVIAVCEVLLYYDEYKDIEEVVEETSLSRRSVYYYINKYLKDKNYMLKKSRPSTLEKYLDIIEKDFSLNPISSCEEAVKRVKELIGIEISRTQVYYFLKNNYFIKENGRYIQKKPDYSIEVDNLEECKDIILEYLDDNLPDNKNVAIKRIRRQFPLIKEEDYKIKKFLEKYWYF